MLQCNPAIAVGGAGQVPHNNVSVLQWENALDKYFRAYPFKKASPELKIRLDDYNNDDDLGLEGQEDEEDRTGT